MADDIKVGMASFARFYDATRAAQPRVVRDIRSAYTDPDGYAGRDYYGDFRNALRANHWSRGDLAGLPAALDILIDKQKVSNKAENLSELRDNYLSRFTDPNTHLFLVPRSELVIAGLIISITPEIGMKINDSEFVLKMWMNRPDPKRLYKQAVQYMLQEGWGSNWRSEWQPAIWKVRNDQILDPVRLPRDIRYSIRAAAVGLQDIWTELGGPVQPPQDDENE